MSFLCLLGVSTLSVCSLCVSAQQRMCERLTRVVDIVAGLPPFQATFEKAPVSERLVIVMALGPYAQVQSDTSGHVRAQFSKFAAANSADLLRLSLRCPLPGLMLQAAQLAKTQIEEFILNCHQAGQKWDCVCLVDEIFDVGASHMSVFDEVPENSVFITQPHLRKDQTRPTNALPSMLVFPTKHINILENWRRAFLANMMPFTVQSSSNEATDSFASVLSNTCAEMGIQVHSVCKDLSSPKDSDALFVFSVCQRAVCVFSVCQRAVCVSARRLCVSFGCQSAVCVFVVCQRALCVSSVCQRALFVSFVCQRAVCVFFVSALSVCHLFISSVCLLCVSALSVCVICVSACRSTLKIGLRLFGGKISHQNINSCENSCVRDGQYCSGETQHSTAPQHHSTAQHSTTAQHNTAQHSTAQHSTAQHSTAAQHRVCVFVSFVCRLVQSNFVKEEEWGASFQDTMFKIVRTLPQLFNLL